jgi:hypothetical protein
MIRTERIPFFQETAALPVLILTTIIAAIGTYIGVVASFCLISGGEVQHIRHHGQICMLAPERFLGRRSTSS